jgi:8-amino-7-oxononanoate synthase
MNGFDARLSVASFINIVYLSGHQQTYSLIPDSLNKKLQTRVREDSLRRLSTPSNLVDFSSNDYLGLSRSRDLAQRIHARVEELQLHNGATGSRLLSGNSEYTERVELKLAKLFKGEEALIFNSGYSANLAVLSSMPLRHDTIIYDELAHACIKDGARLSLARSFSFKHNDLNDLESKLKRISEGNKFIAVESIYSMDGDAAPLAALAALADHYNATLIVDEAHSTGTYGTAGNGLSVALALEHKIPIRIYTFGKAMGIHGACVVGNSVVRDYLINFARPFIYTTALPPHSIAAIECAFDFLRHNTALQKNLKDKIDLFLSSSREFVNRIHSESAIQTALFPGNSKVKRISRELQQKGLDVRPILSPTVPSGTERLRICLHTFNSDEEIILLGSILQELCSHA